FPASRVIPWARLGSGPASPGRPSTHFSDRDEQFAFGWRRTRKIILVDNCLDQKNVSLRIAAPPARTRDYAAAMPMPMSERRRVLPSSNKSDPFHIIHKNPFGDCPYSQACAKHLVCKDSNQAAINAGDRVDSALNDMFVVMKQLNWSDEGVEAIMSFGYLCP
ncbi:LOW QUALITY PROTEIN: hypothetical protein HID58_056838, partial [Brassica napus]